MRNRKPETEKTATTPAPGAEATIALVRLLARQAARAAFVDQATPSPSDNHDHESD